MKIFIILITFILLSVQIGAALVYDHAHLIAPNDLEKIKRWVNELEAKTTTQVAIVTEDSIGEVSVEEYAVQLFEKLGVGQQEKDNGVLLVIAFQNHLLRIEVGYGLEDVVTDVLSHKIINAVIIPEFKKGNYSEGIVKGVREIVSVIALDSQVVISDPLFLKQESENGHGGGLFLLFLILYIIIMVIMSIYVNTHSDFSNHSGGNFGGRGGWGGGGGGGRSGGGGASGKW